MTRANTKMKIGNGTNHFDKKGTFSQIKNQFTYVCKYTKQKATPMSL